MWLSYEGKLYAKIIELAANFGCVVYRMVTAMLSYPNRTFSRAQLMDEFWGVESDTSLRAVDVYITKLRSKFSACDGFKIVTVYVLEYKAVLL